MMRCSFARQAMLACAGVLAAATCLANPYETTLENGLKVIVKEDPRAPSAVSAWCGTGLARWTRSTAPRAWRMCSST